MATEANWLVFHLKTSADWIQWYAAVKDQAVTWGLWDYINPEVAVESLRPLHGTEKTATKTAPDRTARSLVLDLETAGRSQLFGDRTSAV